MSLSEVWSETSQPLGGVALLLQFFHGLAFFALGMAMSFAAPRAGRLEIARRLPLLAIFAFCQATTAWNSVLSCALSVPYVIPPLEQAILLGLGYSVLLFFGLLAPAPSTPPTRAWQFLPIALLTLWLTGVFIFAATDTPGPQIAFWGELIARYGLALPGGPVALWGLKRQTRHSMTPRILRLTRGSLRVTGAALGTFGLLAGLILPSISLLTQTDRETVEASFPIIPFLLTLCGLTLTYGLTRTLYVVQREIERWIESVEHSQALTTDRERIGRELHDGIIQSIYAAGLMLEGVKQLIPENPDAAQTQLSRVMTSLNQTIQDIRRYIFDLREAVPQAALADGLEQILRDFHVNTLLETNLTVDGKPTRPLRTERRRHIFLIAREALSNVARHAQARRVEIHLTYGPNALRLEIADDGVGLTAIPTTGGQGLRNIRERTRLLEGTLDIESAPNEGFTLSLTVPYPEREVP